MAYLDVMLVESGAMNVTETQQKSLVRNTPREESMLEIESAAKNTKERLWQEHDEKLKKERKDLEKNEQQAYQQALEELMDIWFGVGKKEYILLSERAKQQIEELVCIKSRKRRRQKVIGILLFDAALIAGVTSFALLVGNIGGVIILGLVSVLAGALSLQAINEGLTATILRQKKLE